MTVQKSKYCIDNNTSVPLISQQKIVRNTDIYYFGSIHSDS